MQIYKEKGRKIVEFRISFRLNTVRQRYWLASAQIESNCEMYLQLGLGHLAERAVYQEAY